MFGALYLIDCGPGTSGTEVGAEPRVEVPQEPAASEPTQDGGADTVSADEPPTLEPAVCGMAPYKWLPAKEMGSIVSQQQPGLSNLSKAALEALLGQTEFKGVVTIQYGVKIYLVRYVTQDRGKKIEATTLIGIPNDEEQVIKAPYALWLHGTSGFTNACAPSRGQDGLLAVALLASQGYIAVAPDYIGMNGTGDPSETHHAYLVGEAVALGSLDALRAAGTLMKDAEIAGKTEHNGRMFVIGGSQGGHAAFFAALYAPYYTPDYELVAGIAMIPPVDLVAQSEAAITTLGNASITLAAGATAMSRWYGFADKLKEILTDGDPYNIASDLAKLMDTDCDVNADEYKFTKSTDIFTEALYKAITEKKSWEGFEKWRCILAENSLNYTSVKRIVDVPFLFIVSEKDELVNPTVQRKSFDTLCQQGYKMNYIECQGAGHTNGAVWSLPLQLSWIKERLEGVPMKNSCQRTAPTCCPLSDSKVCTP